MQARSKHRALAMQMPPTFLGLVRQHNSAKHSWQIALLSSSMVQYAAAPVNIDHVVAMLLVHDIGVIDASI